MTVRRAIVSCTIALALIASWTRGVAAQAGRLRPSSIEHVAPETVESTRPSPFYDEPVNTAKSTTVRRETRRDAESTPATVREKTPLPTTDFDDQNGESPTQSRSSFGPSLFWAAGILAVGWMARQVINRSPLQGRSLSSLEVVARQGLGPQQQLALIRLGSRVLLVGTTPSSISTLATIEDPLEVNRLLAELRPTSSPPRPGWVDLFRSRQDENRSSPVEAVSLATGKSTANTTSSAPSPESGKLASSLRGGTDV